MSILRNVLSHLLRRDALRASRGGDASAELIGDLREEAPPEAGVARTPESLSAADLDLFKEQLCLAVRAFPPERDVERMRLARYIRNELHDDHLGATATLYGDDCASPGPVRVRLESASACNLRCQHCPTGVNYHATDRSVMKPALFERVIEQMKELPTLRECVLYLGGEPLMNKHLVEMCRRVKAETTVARTLITTNAMLLDERACAGLATARLDRILVSVDGRSPEENDAIRLRASYAKIVENVVRLRRHLAGTDTGITISHSMFRRQGDPPEAQPPEFLKRDFPGLPIYSDYATRWPGFEVDKCSLASTALKSFQPRNFCDFPFFELAVRANGDVVLCCHDLLGESVMGNVNHSTLRRIWNDSAYRGLRRGMLARDEKAVHPVCRKCFVFTGERIVRD